MAASNSTSVATIALPFETVYAIMKNNERTRFEEVYRTLLLRSDYVKVIPDKEEYAILHYLVIHGALDLFKKVIAIPNIYINLLMRTAGKPPTDIQQIIISKKQKTAEDRELGKLINQLVNLDKFSEFAKTTDFQKCFEMLDQDEELINNKPPYRKYYLLHHLAYCGNRKQFDALHSKHKFNLTVLTNDQQTASEVALENNHKEFAEYLEQLSPQMREIREGHQKRNKKPTRRDPAENEILQKKIFAIGGESLVNTLSCPLTKEILFDPVVLSDGFTYEREAIQYWLSLGNKTSPMTNSQLTSLELIPNASMKQIIVEMSKKI